MNQYFNIHYSVCYKLILADFSDNDLAVYMALKSLYNINMEKQVVGIKMIYYQLYGVLPKDRKKRDYLWISESVTRLADNEFICIVESSGDYFVLDMSAMRGNVHGKDKEDYYCKIYLWQLQDIFKKNKRVIRYLLNYLHMKSSNDDNSFFRRARESIADQCNIGIRTVDRYNEILEDAKIIYIYKYKEFRYADSHKTVNNCYGLFRDKEYIKGVCEKYKKERLESGTIHRIKHRKQTKNNKNN